MSENQSPQPSDSLYDDTTTEDVLRDIWNDIVQKDDDDAHGKTVPLENSAQNELSSNALDTNALDINALDTSALDSSEEQVAEQMTLSSMMSQPIPTIGQSGLSEPIDTVDEDWDAVELPGTVVLNGADLAKGIASSVEQTVEKTDEQSPPIAAGRENELLTLIHDLNECNDALLMRVSQLEGELDETRRTRQTEAEQAQIAYHKLSERVCAEQASAQEVSHNAQQQVAKLVAQLESTQQALQRQHLVTETLQAELENSKERIIQLEHESALTTQQHAAEAQARIQAETSNRDLRSRLQRQQRYTLQFKAALEKSLTVSARSATDFNTSDFNTADLNTVGFKKNRAPAQPTAFSEQSGVNMPKAQQIMPWASASTVPFEGIDPHLENLIRSAGQRNAAQQPIPSINSFDASTSSKADADATESPVTPAADPEAEKQLWQDLERVMDITDTPDIESILGANANHTAASVTVASQAVVSQSAAAAEPSVTAIKEEDPNVVKETSQTDCETVDASLEELSTEGKLSEEDLPTASLSEEESSKETTFNWQQGTDIQTATEPVNAEQADNKQTAAAQADVDPVSDDLPDGLEALPTVSTTDIPSLVIEPYSPPAGKPLSASAVAFTEPSPWGKPPSVPVDSAEVVAEGTQGDEQESREGTYLPAVDGDVSGISPVVNRLRSQKKISSLSSVQLPTFETAKSGSFKR